MRIPFLDLRINSKSERKELLFAVERVFCHGRLVLGPEVQRLENKIASYCGRKYAVAVNSGTDALFLGLKALGIGSQDEVITTSLSWVATANAIALTGAKPVFADIGNDLNIDPKSVERLITRRTRTILPVHFTGKVCRMDELRRIARKHKLNLVEDAAQAFGAIYRGKRAGSFGDIACFSMNPMKVFAACGEAGIIVTDNKGLYDSLVSLRYNGTINREKCIEPSLNARIDTLQAAILLQRLGRVEGIIRKRREIASWYKNLLGSLVQIPQEQPGCRDVYYTYTIQAENRDKLKRYLELKGVETKIQHPYLMPQQPAYIGKARGEYKNASRLLKKILCIPANEKITRQQVEYTARCVRDFYQS